MSTAVRSENVRKWSENNIDSGIDVKYADKSNREPAMHSVFCEIIVTRYQNGDYYEKDINICINYGIDNFLQ